jgi:hypothetical protein
MAGIQRKYWTVLYISGQNPPAHRHQMADDPLQSKLREDWSMKTRLFSLIGIFIGISFNFSAALSFAQTRPEYIPLGGGVKGVLYRPDSNPTPEVAVIIIHRTSNYLQHAGWLLARYP